MRRPGGQGDDLEGRRHAAVGLAEFLRIDRGGARQRGAARRGPAARDEGVALAHAAQVAHQREGVGIGHRDGVDVGHRQREVGALQQGAGRAHLGEGRDPGADARLLGQLGLHQRGAQLGKGLAAEQGAEEQAVGLERLANLNQRPGQVVDPVQAKHAHDQVEAARPERQGLLVGGQGRPAGRRRGPGHGRREIALDQGLDPAAAPERAPQRAAVAAKVERHGEFSGHVVQALGQALGDLREQKIVRGQIHRGAVAAPAQQAPVEDVERVAHGTALVMARLWRNSGARQSLPRTPPPRAVAGVSGALV